MKKFLLSCVFVLFIGFAFAQEMRYEADAFDKEKVNIKNQYGQPVGYAKVDAFDKSKINIYNQYGQLIGTNKK